MKLAILTPLTPQHAAFLHEAARSVRAVRRRLADVDCSVRWLAIADWHLTPDEAKSIGRELRFGGGELLMLSARRGPGPARSAGLRAALGSDLVMPLDADDVLLPGGVSAMLSAIYADPSMDWVAARRRVEEINPVSGKLRRYDPDGRAKRTCWEPGELETRWSRPFPFPPKVVMSRRSAALATAGWGEGVADELGWILELAGESRGCSLTVPALLYRRWSGGKSAQADYPRLLAEAERKIADRRNRRRQRLGLGRISPPAGLNNGKSPASSK